MSGINFLSENYNDIASASITTGAEDAQFPLSNLKIDATSYKFRSQGDTVVIELDLLQTRDLDTFAITGDAAGTFDLTSVSIKTSVTNDFSLSPSLLVPLSGTNNIGWVFFPEVSHRFVEITISGNGVYAELSNIFIGKRINLPFQNLDISSFRYRYFDQSDVKRNSNGQRFIDERFLVKNLVGTIRYLNTDELDILDAMFQRHGRNKPLWMIVDADGTSFVDSEYKLSIYGYFNEMPGFSAVSARHYNSSIDMQQVV